MANSNWDGIVVRCNVGETGVVPRNYSSNSPDIILNGTTPLADPSILTKPENYDNSYNNDLYGGVPNFLYVRGKNFTQKKLEGSWNLYYSPSNIILYPYLWEKNQLVTSQGDKNPNFSIEAGKIGASEDCFQWVPQPLPSGQHYCMIAVAVTPEHGNPMHGLNNINDIAQYYINNGNIAQRNTRYISGDVPELVDMVGYNQGSEPSKVDIAIVFKNIPKGSSYKVSCGTPVDGKTLFHSEDKTVDNDFKYAWTDINMPANWCSYFSYSVKFGSDWSGIPADAHPTVQIRGELVQESADRLYHLGATAEPHPLTGEMRLDNFGSPVKLITVGTYKTACPDVKHR